MFPYRLYIEHGSGQSCRSWSASGRPAAAWPIKTGRRCDYCGSQFGDLRPWDWPPDNRTHTIWLHERCEAPWYDSGGAPQDVR